MIEKALGILIILIIGTCSGTTLNSLFQQHFGNYTTTVAPSTILPQLSNSEQCNPTYYCVEPYLCNNGIIRTDGSAILDHRSDLPCDLPKICCRLDEDKSDDKENDTSLNECGNQNVDGVGFNHGQLATNQTKYGEFPWMVAILEIGQNRNVTYKRGGSLLTPGVVLTTASYVHQTQTNKMTVVAGAWDNDNPSQLYPQQDRLVERKIVHEKFNSANHRNDIALLIVQRPFELSPVVKTVCLPPADASFDYVSDCYGIGWGKDRYRLGKHQSILKKIKLPIVSHNECQDQLRKTRLSEYFILNRSFLCAGGDRDVDMCTADGGSPLVCPMGNSPTRFYQVGIVSWGIGCGKENVPGLYTNVPYLRQWIDTKLAAENVNSTFYTP